MDAWTGGQIAELMAVWMDIQADERTDRCTDGTTHRQQRGRTSRQRQERDERTCVMSVHSFSFHVKTRMCLMCSWIDSCVHKPECASMCEDHFEQTDQALALLSYWSTSL